MVRQSSVTASFSIRVRHRFKLGSDIRSAFA
jgi:hypothetical protein